MPLFRYHCKGCGAENEILLRGGESPVCPGCGSSELEKMLSTFAPMKAAPSHVDNRPSCCSGCAGAGTGSCPYS